MSPDSGPYNYLPSRTVAIIMLTLFGISTVVQAGQATRYRMWWLLPTACLCGIIELIGWSGRLWSSFSPLASTPFQIEITCTIIAPTPLLAANFVILSLIIHKLGAQYSRLSPRLYMIIFTTCDVVSLVVQGAGGGIAATAIDAAGSNNGAHIMLGGIVFQVVVIVAFSALAIEYFTRYHTDSPLSSRIGASREKESQLPSGPVRGAFTGKILLMSSALAFSTLLLFIRAIYRTAELADGWHGKIISDQVLFNVLDGAMVILAMYTLNIAHPGLLLATPAEEKEPNESI
ncbi:hypothetical protein HYPSUDRAFT_136271 [Hypholoma sublateritium FD-334 SS-4]|uniref:RTA1 like protein n=1 Tax=Hypholoma sublateritium (strain FD-334 SS-4) TaxID=945553 RepID=A0A0D2P0D0_HYPSF|nr:hypothetical protein HYPSUDRAFT_136271 [Hypholoma sublateritium FD-334 SS-4]